VDTIAGIKILVVIYPVESLLTFICLLGAIVLTEARWGKVLIVVCLGMLVTGLPFAVLGFSLICTLIQYQTSPLIKYDWLYNN
jgi:hypothetical protein